MTASRRIDFADSRPGRVSRIAENHFVRPAKTGNIVSLAEALSSSLQESAHSHGKHFSAPFNPAREAVFPGEPQIAHLRLV
jgi:hypothetical protein